MNRNGYREEKSWCYFHPKQVVVGVCPLCLNERLLLLLASKHHNSSSHKLQQTSSINHIKQPTSSIHKIFAFGSLFTRLDSRHCKSGNHHFDLSPSPEESFISIKFEDNGVASWEKNCKKKNNSMSVSSINDSKTNKSVIIEHGKSSRETFRWRKRISHVFQLIRWKKKKKSTSTTTGGGGGVFHVGSVGVGVKVRNTSTNSKAKGNWKSRSSATTME